MTTGALPWARLGWASSWRVTAVLLAVTAGPALLAAWVVEVLAGTAYAVEVVALGLLGALSVLAHETGHLLALRVTSPHVRRDEVAVGRTWLSASVERPRLPRAAERRVAAAGPAAGAAAGLPLLLVPVPALLRAVLLVPFCLHLLSLVPCFPDGRNFWSTRA